jgi:glycosyltransferase involved in cell wall biosynthesis
MLRPGEATPKVSIVIPTYNTERYILEALKSLEEQTYKNLEIIVVDDGSTDDTSKLLREHGGNCICYHQENAGQSAAMNFGWKQSTGTILGYLSADDRLHPDAIEKVVASMLDNPTAVLAYPDFCIIDENSNYVRTITPPEYNEELLVADFQCLPGPGALFHREAWEKTVNTALFSE